MGEPTRTYRHQACGGETVISGKVLQALATPFMGPSLTECASCGKTDLVNKFVWTHTEENIDQAHARIRRGLPLPMRIVTSVTFVLVVMLLGIGIGVAVGVWDRWWTGILAGFGALTVLIGLNLGAMHLLALVYRIKFEDLL